MGIKFKVAQEVTYRVEGVTKEGAREVRFDFELTADRVSQEDVSLLFSEHADTPVADFLAPKVHAWRGVTDGDVEVPYSEANLRALLNEYPGVGQLAMTGYLDAIGAKGRRKN